MTRIQIYDVSSTGKTGVVIKCLLRRLLHEPSAQTFLLDIHGVAKDIIFPQSLYMSITFLLADHPSITNVAKTIQITASKPKQLEISISQFFPLKDMYIILMKYCQKLFFSYMFREWRIFLKLTNMKKMNYQNFGFFCFSS